jgi:hypothetical protein
MSEAGLESRIELDDLGGEKALLLPDRESGAEGCRASTCGRCGMGEAGVQFRTGE